MGLRTLPAGKNIRLFDNQWLERLPYVHPILPIAVWGPVVVLCFAVGLYQHLLSLSLSLGLALVGLFFWTFAEYVLHRYVFHFHPRGRIQERIAFLIHGIHHDDPHDARRLLMPPVAAILIAAFFYALFLLVLGPVRCNPFFAGFITGYLCYDYIHFITHFVPVKHPWLKQLKANHMRHHFSTPDLRYGVSSPLWDRVFKT